MWKLWAILIKNFKDVVSVEIKENLLDLHFTEARTLPVLVCLCALEIATVGRGM